MNIQQTGYFEGFDDLSKDEKKTLMDSVYGILEKGRNEHGKDWFEDRYTKINKLFEQKTGYERVDNQEVLTDGGLIRPEDRVGV